MTTTPDYSPDREVEKENAVPNWLSRKIEHYKKLSSKQAEVHDDLTPKVREDLFPKIVRLTATIFLVTMILVPAITGWLTASFTNGAIMLVPFLVYAIAGFRSVAVDEVAGADFFGQPVMQFDKGLYWIPPVVLNFSKEKATYVQSEFPGDADHVQWTDEEVPLQAGKVRPIYVLTGENPKGKLPTDKQMNIGIAALVKFQLEPKRFFDLITNVGPIDKEKRDAVKSTMTGGENLSDIMLEVVRHLRDTTAAFLAETAGKMSYNETVENLHLINELLLQRLQETVINWGVKVLEARITKLNPGHQFNKNLQLRGDAMSIRDNKIIVAEGERKRLILEGEGAASAELALLKAKADGYKAIQEKAGVDGQTAISAETAGKLAASGNVVVVGTSGVNDLLGIVAASKKVK